VPGTSLKCSRARAGREADSAVALSFTKPPLAVCGHRSSMCIIASYICEHENAFDSTLV
jgi:hypothetical protein